MGKSNIIANLQDKIALVTGAGRGIGRSISMALANAGAQVVVCSRTAAEIEKVVREISSKNGRAIAVPADVASESEVTSMFESVEDRFGRIDILVNNAGVGRSGSVADFEVRQFDELMAVNLRGTFLIFLLSLSERAAIDQIYIRRRSSSPF
jgi:NAD(P)-dependent dehydrogenase (short-subunit alcohol dehydrogenase family)